MAVTAIQLVVCFYEVQRWRSEAYRIVEVCVSYIMTRHTYGFSPLWIPLCTTRSHDVCELLAVVLLLLHLQDERESWFLFPCVSLLHSLILRQCNVTVHFLPFRLVFHHYCIGSLHTKMLIAELMVHTQAAADRNAMLLEDNDKDKRLLRQLEKNLKMKKRKSNNLPLAFVNDGLDCILYVSARMNRHVFECLYV